jgi:hypothetical protein
MPAVMDTPEHITNLDTPAHLKERPRVRGARPGCWRTLRRGITRLLTPLPREWHVPPSSVRHSFETPMDRLVREYPSISVYALAIV